MRLSFYYAQIRERTKTMREFNNGIIVRVSKADARRIYNAGGKVMMLPVKANVYYTGFKGWEMLNNKGEHFIYAEKTKMYQKIWQSEFKRDFDCLVNEFEYYECNADMGEYAKFFTTVGEVAV